MHYVTHKVFQLMTQENVDIKALTDAFKKMEKGSDSVFQILDEILHNQR